MNRKGSAYVGLVVVALCGYFVYQTWFNPSRAVKRRLGEIAATLSVQDGESEIERIARLARLRGYLANDVKLLVGGVNLDSSGTIVGVLAGIRPPTGGVDVQFVDVEVAIDSGDAAHAGLMLELNTKDPATGEWRAEQHETIGYLERRAGEWIVVRGEIRDPQQK